MISHFVTSPFVKQYYFPLFACNLTGKFPGVLCFIFIHKDRLIAQVAFRKHGKVREL